MDLNNVKACTFSSLNLWSGQTLKNSAQKLVTSHSRQTVEFDVKQTHDYTFKKGNYFIIPKSATLKHGIRCIQNT